MQITNIPKITFTERKKYKFRFILRIDGDVSCLYQYFLNSNKNLVYQKWKLKALKVVKELEASFDQETFR